MPNFKPWQWTTLMALMLAVDGVLGACLVLSLMAFGPWAERADTVAEAGAPSKPAPTLRPTFTPTATPEVWPTATSTRTPTRMPPPTPTWTPLPTRTPTITPTPWPTDTPTPYRPPTDTPTVTPTRTPVPTRTPLPSATATPAPTDTPTSTPTNEPTSTWTPAPTPSWTPLPTSTPTLAPSPTSTPTSTMAPAPAVAMLSKSATSTATGVPIPSLTPTSTTTPVPSSTPTNTATPTPLPTSTNTATSIPSATPTALPSPSATPTLTPTPLPSPSATSTPVPSPTPRPTRRATSTPAAIALAPPVSEGQPLEATSLSDYSIGLAWQPVAGATTYRIYSDMGTGYGVYLFKAEAERPTLTDENLVPGLRYTYRMGAVSRTGETMGANATALTSGQAPVASSGEGPAKAAGQASFSTAKPAPASAPLRVTPAPTPLPPDTIILGMLSSTDYANEVDGTLTIVGEVRNDSALDVGETAVTATFYDANGQVIGEVGSPTLLSTLTPGVRSPFILTLPRPAGVANYSLRATGRPVTLPAVDGSLVVVNTRRFEDTTGFYHIAGVVQNRETQKVEQARIIVTLYDRGGRVINVGFAYPQPSALAPGDRADFDVSFTYYPKVFSHSAIAVRD